MGNSKLSPNIIPPCGGYTGTPVLGGCFQSFRPDHVVPLYRNVTQVANYDTGSNPAAYITPYPIAIQTPGTPDCSPYNAGGCPDNPCYHCGDFGASNSNVPCWPLDPSKYKTPGPGTSSLGIGSYFNAYALTNETVSLSHCRNLGYKNCISSKAWPGRRSYHSSTNPQPSNFDWCCGCVFTPQTLDVDRTKYLSVSSTGNQSISTNIYNCDTILNGTFTCFDQFGNPYQVNDYCTTCVLDHVFTANASATAVTVCDKFGNITTGTCDSGSTNSDGDPLYDAYFSDDIFSALGAANDDWSTLVNVFCGQIRSALTAYGQPVVATGGQSDSHDVEFHVTLTALDKCGNVVARTDVIAEKLVINVSAGTLDYYTYGPKLPKTFCVSDGYNPAWIQTSHYSYNFGGNGSTVFDLTIDATGIGSISLDSTFHRAVAGSLASPYEYTDVINDAETLLGYWKMDDETMMPWRTQVYGIGGVNNGPYICYDEGNTIPTVPVCAPIIQFSGSNWIKGKPFPVAIDRVWNPYHQNYCVCDSLVQPGCSEFYPQDQGAWSTDIGTPRATQWLDEFQQSNMPQGAFAQSNQMFTIPGTCNSAGPTRIFDDTLWMAKWALLIPPGQQRYNLARPCGYDRFKVSGSTGRCISSVSIGTFPLVTIDPSQAPTDIRPNDKVWIIGTDTLDGAWVAQSVDPSGYNIGLKDPRIVSASTLPRQPIEKYDTGIIGRLIWQHNEAPGVCGRVDITQATNTAPVTLSLADTTYLATGDVVEVVNSVGNNINGEWTITVSSSNQIFLNGSNGISQSVYTGSGQLYVSGSVDWRWNATKGVGNFRRMEWQYNYRPVGEYFRMAAQSASLDYNNGARTCDGVNPCYNPQIPVEPGAFQPGCFIDQNITLITCSTHCLNTTNATCQGAVAFFSPPEQETFGTTGSIVQSINLGWIPNNFGIDSIYGSNWQAIVKSTISDPLWQQPPCPCESVIGSNPLVYACDFIWAQDDGSCIGDGIDPISGLETKYYALPDQFEAICRISDTSPNAPPLPPGISIDCSPISVYTSSNCPPVICGPPFVDAQSVFANSGCGNPSAYPYEFGFATYLNELQCVCLNGQFKTDYQNNGVICDSNFFINLP